jgi:low temperature requirement protein LtrA
LSDKKYTIWWGPPRKFSRQLEERKISWLELFYDLVYVIAIAKITHHLSSHLNLSGLLDYIYIFGMIFWGWFNGSFHHDLHGTTGLRTNLMTLWQMIIVAALIVTLNSPAATLIFNATIALVAMQLFITYLWWSVGIYDKEHRAMNRPYTICFLISLVFLLLTFFIDIYYVRTFFYLSLILNFLPPFLVIKNSKERASEFLLSSSMTERLGLLTIILFGEVVSGAINGVSGISALRFQTWINFGLAILIIFAAWWIFFTMIADRNCRQGYLQGYFMTLVYIPTLMALGMIGVAFTGLFERNENATDGYFPWIRIAFGISLCIFLFGILLISRYLHYPDKLAITKRKWQITLFSTAFVVMPLAFAGVYLSLFSYLSIIFMILLAAIILISKSLIALNRNSAGETEAET